VSTVRFKIKFHLDSSFYYYDLVGQLIFSYLSVYRSHCQAFANICCREIITEGEIPAELTEEVSEKRRELIESVSEADDELAEVFLNDEPISGDLLQVILGFPGYHLRRLHCCNSFESHLGRIPK
jgi:hypothetical protein